MTPCVTLKKDNDNATRRNALAHNVLPEAVTTAIPIVSPDDQRVTFVELFFDLVFVFCVTQVVTLLHGHVDARSVGSALLVFWLVWWAWTQFTWARASAGAPRAAPRSRRANGVGRWRCPLCLRHGSGHVARDGPCTGLARRPCSGRSRRNFRDGGGPCRRYGDTGRSARGHRGHRASANPRELGSRRLTTAAQTHRRPRSARVSTRAPTSAISRHVSPDPRVRPRRRRKKLIELLGSAPLVRGEGRWRERGRTLFKGRMR